MSLANCAPQDIYAATPTASAIPSYTPTITDTPTPTATATLTPSATNTLTFTPTNTATRKHTITAAPTTSNQPLYLSLADKQTIGSISAADEDILGFNGQVWSMFFDGSDVGTTNVDLTAFSFIDSNSLLMTFDATVTLNGISVSPQDIVRLDATSLGNTTAGTFGMYFDGSDVGLTTTNEAIDALDLFSGDIVVLSTVGDVSVTDVTGSNEDLLAFTATSLGSTTSGTWSIWFDGSDVGLGDTADENMDAVDVSSDWTVYLSTVGNFAVSGVSGADEDVFVCTPTSIGATTACTYSSALYFDGSIWGLSANEVDGFNTLPPTSPQRAICG